MDIVRAAGMLGIDAEKAKKMSFKEFFVALMEKMGDQAAAEFNKAKTAKIVDKKIDGSKCTLKIKTAEKEDDMELVQEGGKWYIAGGMKGAGPGPAPDDDE